MVQVIVQVVLPKIHQVNQEYILVYCYHIKIDKDLPKMYYNCVLIGYNRHLCKLFVIEKKNIIIIM